VLFTSYRKGNRGEAEAVLGNQIPPPHTFARGFMTTEECGSQGDQFVKSRRSTGEIIMEQAEVVEGIMDTLPGSQPALWAGPCGTKYLCVM
jgi:hypothetical protein